MEKYDERRKIRIECKELSTKESLTYFRLDFEDVCSLPQRSSHTQLHDFSLWSHSVLFDVSSDRSLFRRKDWKETWKQSWNTATECQSSQRANTTPLSKLWTNSIWKSFWMKYTSLVRVPWVDQQGHHQELWGREANSRQRLYLYRQILLWNQASLQQFHEEIWRAPKQDHEWRSQREDEALLLHTLLWALLDVSIQVRGVLEAYYELHQGTLPRCMLEEEQFIELDQVWFFNQDSLRLPRNQRVRVRRSDDFYPRQVRGCPQNAIGSTWTDYIRIPICILHHHQQVLHRDSEQGKKRNDCSSSSPSNCTRPSPLWRWVPRDSSNWKV